MEIPKSGGVSAASTTMNMATDARSVEVAPPSQTTLLTGAKAPQAAASPDQLRDVMQQLEEAISTKAQGLRFSLDDESGKTIVKIIDETTDTVLRQIPSEEMLELAKSLDKMQGLLVRQQA